VTRIDMRGSTRCSVRVIGGSDGGLRTSPSVRRAGTTARRAVTVRARLRDDHRMTEPVAQRYLDFLGSNHRGVVVTLKRDGRPQLSNVVYGFDAGTGRVRVSVTADRAKTRNAARDPRVSIHVSSADFWSYVVAEGEAELTAGAADPADAAVADLVDLYRSLSGEHPDWDDFRSAMIRERRQVLSFAVTHAYGQVPG
jgi:PPOX class probable F420-dependent enzyme